MKYLYCFVSLLTFMFVACTSESDTVPSDKGENGSGDDSGLILHVSDTYVELKDGAFDFTVLYNGINVTAQATIYQKTEQGNTALSGACFSVDETGSYTFFASYKGEISPNVSVQVVNGMLDVPTDSQPNRFTGFKRCVLAVEGTSLACGYCPMMMAGLQEFMKTEESRQTVIVTVHGLFKDSMTSDYSTRLLNYLGINSLPFLTFDLNRDLNVRLIAEDTPTTVMERIKSEVVACLSEPASSAIAASTACKDDCIQVTADIKIAQTGSYRVTAWIIEDGLIYEGQNNYYPELEEDYTFSTYSEVLRCIASTDQVTGWPVGGYEFVSQYTVNRFHYEFPLSEMTIENLKNVRVVILVNKSENGGRYTTDNVIVCGLNDEKTFEYEN